MKLKTFPMGGVHPQENKISAENAIETLPLPPRVFIPIAQHLGAPANVLVKKGDKVKVGTLIAESAGFISANVHSSVSGTVFNVDDVLDTTGYKRKAVIIDVEGDEWEEKVDKTPNLITDIKLTTQEVVDRVKECGTVGLGGATFPSHVKLMVPQGKQAECLVINGVECEPYLTSDHRVMLEHADELLMGVKIVMNAVGVSRAVIGIENNKPDAIFHLRTKAAAFQEIEIQPLKVMYPQGGEKQLIKATTGKEVPSGGLPIDVGVVVLNVGTTLAIYNAVQKNRPLIERIVTVTGKNVEKPSNFLVRIGTPISHLIENAGGIPKNTGKVINGGPMMGKALSSIEAPVTKGTSGILLMTEEEAKRNITTPCIRCAKCAFICPMGLEPHLISNLSEKHRFEELEQQKITDCIECGSCSYTCPASIPLLDYIRVGKNKTIQLIRSRK